MGKYRDSRGRAGYLFISPWLVGFLLFNLFPIVSVILLSFSEYSILKAPRFVGLQNYARLLLGDRLFWLSMKNTLYNVFLAVPLRMAAALVLSLMLNAIRDRFSVPFRAIFYFPTIVPVVAVASIWMWLYDPNSGLINYFLGLVGLPQPLWLASEVWSKPSLVLMNLWTIGSAMVIYLAGLKGIPYQIYEAAKIDGSQWYRTLFRITLPLISPTLFFSLVMNIIGSFQVFEHAYMMTKGGPMNSTLFYSLYMYRQAFGFFRMGYACALAMILLLIILSITLMVFRSGKYWVFKG